MNRLVIEITESRDLKIYADADVDLTLIDWKEVREDMGDLPSWSKGNPAEEAERELLHKTTGLKQVYP